MKSRYRILAAEMSELTPAEQRLVEGFTRLKWIRQRIKRRTWTVTDVYPVAPWEWCLGN